MTNKLLKSLALLVFIIPAQRMEASVFGLADWCLNLNGDVNTACNGAGSGGASGTGSISLTSFDRTLEPTSNNLGTATVTLGPGNGQYASFYADYDVNYPTLGAFQDFASVHGTLLTGLSYEAEDPNSSNIFGDFSGTSPLANVNQVGTASAPPAACCDVSFAMELSGINVPVGDTETVQFKVSSLVPSSGFYIQQTNLVTNTSIYLQETSTLNITGTPEPSTLLLLLPGLAGLIVACRRERRVLLAKFLALPVLACLGIIVPGQMMAATPPQANAVPFVGCNPSNPTCSPAAPHTSWSGNPITLKGTLTSAAFGTDTFTYDWNPGDGGTHCTGTVTNQFVIACAHTYTGTVGTVYTAVLNITDTTTGLVSPPSNCPPTITQGACYYTSLNTAPPNLPIEVNNAIDSGLWYLHTLMRHFKTTGGALAGDWTGVGGNVDSNGAGDTGVNSLECSAFENSGFVTTNIPANPYSNDVQLCLTGVFDQLTKINIAPVKDPVSGTFNPDSNGNGIGVQHNGGYTNYQTGMMLDAIVSSGTPTMAIPTGTTLATAIGSLAGTGTGGAYTFKDAVVDMVDDYVYCQNQDNSGESRGGWHYTCQEVTGDNSVSQWAAIGIIPARRTAGYNATIPAEVSAADEAWLDSSFTKNSARNGYFGYTSNSPIWGPFADTPSGLVQLAMNGLGRGTTSPGGNTLWDSAETYIRDNFGVPQSSGSTSSMKDYYYGMFSFTKAMILHDNSGTGLSNSPITYLQSLDDPGTCKAPGVPVTSPGSGTGPCYAPIDWYAAQTSAHGGTDPTDGVARTIVGNQLANGSWFGQNYSSNQNYFQTGISITMLNKTVTNTNLAPVACFTATPSAVDSGGPVLLDGSCSSDQNPIASLVSWQWDISGTGAGYSIAPGSPLCLTPSCSKISSTFTLPAGQTAPYNFPVKLLVTDNTTPTALTGSVAGSVVIANPPNPPTANPGGPYNFCPNTTVSGALIYTPFLLDGSRSTNPDQGKTDGTAGAPPSTITAYDWDYACAGTFNSAHGSQVNATTAFDIAADFGTSFNVCLRVTNNDNLAFPLAKLPAGLTSVASTGVTIHQPIDEACTHCVQTLGGLPKAPTPSVPGTIQLYWTDTNTAAFPIDHYNVYRSTSATFVPYVQIAGANSSPFLPAVQVSSPSGGTVYFLDSNVAGGTTYYYRIAPATVNDTETCQGNLILAVALSKGR